MAGKKKEYQRTDSERMGMIKVEVNRESCFVGLSFVTSERVKHK